MGRGHIGVVLAVFLAVVSTACNSTPSNTCSSACQTLMPCASVNYSYGCAGGMCGYTYQYGPYASNGAEFTECVNGCEALSSSQQTEISTCVTAAPSCIDALACD